MYKAKSVEGYIQDHPLHTKEIELLREIITKEDLNEEIKWGAPCYSWNNKLVVGIGSFKTYCGIWFYQGAVMADPYKKMINAQEGVTKAMRQWRFESVEEIVADQAIISEYIQESILHFQNGNEIKADKKKPLHIPIELASALEKDNLTAVFDALNLTKKREFTEHIDSAKREATKQARLEKILPMIAKGVGLNDKYR